jgi:hypothetical protein
MDKFPEAFRRFEEVVDTDKIHSYSQLKSTFEIWSFQKSLTYKQNEALKIEAERIGLREKEKEEEPREKHVYKQEGKYRLFRHETFTVRGKRQTVTRDLKTGRFMRDIYVED